MKQHTQYHWYHRRNPGSRHLALIRATLIQHPSFYSAVNERKTSRFASGMERDRSDLSRSIRHQEIFEPQPGNTPVCQSFRAIIVSSHFDIVLCPNAHSDSNVFHRKLIKDNPTPNQNQPHITLRASILSRSSWSQKKTLLLYLKYMQ